MALLLPDLLKNGSIQISDINSLDDNRAEEEQRDELVQALAESRALKKIIVNEELIQKDLTVKLCEAAFQNLFVNTLVVELVPLFRWVSSMPNLTAIELSKLDSSCPYTWTTINLMLESCRKLKSLSLTGDTNTKCSIQLVSWYLSSPQSLKELRIEDGHNSLEAATILAEGIAQNPLVKLELINHRILNGDASENLLGAIVRGSPIITRPPSHVFET